ncbi:MAG: PAS domain S-box protein [Syntrophorhabdaceae bacterium]|nr:PAS domain S-box protein [Syntrophorhabdaceae bacterium]
MKDPSGTASGLIEKISFLKQRIRELEQSESDRQRAEEALQESEERYRKVADFTYAWEYWLAPDNKYVYVSPACERISGYRAEEFLQNPELLVNIIHPDDKHLLASHIHDALQDKSDVSALDFRIITRDGQERWIGHVCQAVYSHTGDYLGRRGSNLDITERKQSEEKFKAIFDNASDGILLANPITKSFLQGNAAICTMLGYTKEEIRNLTIYDIHPTEDISRVLDEFEKQAKGEKTLAEDLPVLRKDGSIFYADIGSTGIAVGDIPYIMGIFHDITDRKLAEEALKTSEGNLRTILDSVNDAIFIHNIDGKIIDVNSKVLEMYGVCREDAITMTIEKDFSARDNPINTLSAIWEAVMRGQERIFEWKARRPKDGRTFSAEVFLRKIMLNNTDAILAAVRDITDRKRLEEALENDQIRLVNDQIRLTAVLDSIDALVYVADFDSYELLFLNKYGRKEWGDIGGKRCWEALQKGQDGPCKFCTNKRLLSGTGVPTGVYRWEFQNTKNGRWYNCRDQAIRWTDGRLVRLEIAIDITESKHIKETLLNEKNKFLTLSESTPLGMVMIDTKGHFTYINPRFKEMFGYGTEDIPDGRAWFQKAYPDPEYRKTVISAWVEDLKRAKVGQKRPRIFKVNCKDGTEKIINFIPVQLETGEQIMNCDDITEQKRLERQLQTVSLTDELTGLYNRRGFITLSGKQLKIAERTKKDMLLFFADLDRMKEINDTLGHQAGDMALVEVAAIFKEVFRESDIIGRMGGDEFAILTIDTTDEAREVLTDRLQKTLDNYNRPEGRNYTLSLSIGIARYDPERPCSLDELMTQADTLMYVEKRNKQ